MDLAWPPSSRTLPTVFPGRPPRWLLPRPEGPEPSPGANRLRRPPGATNGVPDRLVGPAMLASLLDGGHEHFAIELRPHARHDLGVEQGIGLGLAVELVPLAPSLGLGQAARCLPAWPPAAPEAAGGDHLGHPQAVALGLVLGGALVLLLLLAILGEDIEAADRITRSGRHASSLWAGWARWPRQSPTSAAVLAV